MESQFNPGNKKKVRGFVAVRKIQIMVRLWCSSFLTCLHNRLQQLRRFGENRPAYLISRNGFNRSIAEIQSIRHN